MFAWRRNRTVICTQSDLNHTWLSSIRDPPRPHPASFPDIEAPVCLHHNLHSCSSVALLLQVGMLEIATMKHNRFCLGIRSLAFNSEVLSFGTGSGYIFFFDLRAMKYLEMNCSHALVLKGGKGWTRVRIRCFCLLTKFSSKTNLLWFKKLNKLLFQFEDEDVHYGFGEPSSPAIYTHCYDESRTRIFAAGGPLRADMCGNYAALWQWKGPSLSTVCYAFWKRDWLLVLKY